MGSISKRSNRNPKQGTPEYNRNIIEHEDPGRYIPVVFLLYSWGSLFGVPSKVPANMPPAPRDPGGVPWVPLCESRRGRESYPVLDPRLHVYRVHICVI